MDKLQTLRLGLTVTSGQPHTSRNDPKVHVSGQIFKNGKRVTSLHVYEDGTVGYSKEIFNESQEE